MATPQTKEQFIEKLTEYKYFRYAVIGSEIGAEGTPHFQGYLELTQQTSVKQKNDLLVGCHSDLRRGSAAQAADYCKKRWRLY